MFDDEKHSLGKVFRENRVGLYTTVSVHLAAMIVLLLCRIHDVVKTETALLLDFSQQEAQEAEMQKQERREQFEKELDDMLTPARHHNIRNVAVDEAEQVLRDDRHRDPAAIYDEARRVQESLDASRKALQQQQGGDEALQSHAAASGNQAEAYKGPSVLSYNLGGRKAMRLPIPVYRCRGGGDVTVRIEVDRRGYVVSTTVNAAASTANTCLVDAARRAAQTSRFAPDPKAPARQQGHIVYRFIAQ